MIDAKRIRPALTAAAVAIVCALSAAPAQEAPRPLTLTVTSEGVEAPETVPAGFHTFEIVDDADQGGAGIEIARLNDGVTPDEAREATAAVGAAYEGGGDPGAAVEHLASLITAVGGEGMPPATAELTPGTYLVTSTMNPSLWTTFEVQEGEAAAEAPPADVTIDMMEFAFSLPDELPAGPQTWEVRNVGEQVHHMVLLRVADDATVEDVMAYLESEQNGPPPGEEVGYVAVLSPGVANYVEFDLEPATYVAVCFLPDYDTGMPHAALGMVADFTVASR